MNKLVAVSGSIALKRKKKECDSDLVDSGDLVGKRPCMVNIETIIYRQIEICVL
jgi:hypothetical protein